MKLIVTGERFDVVSMDDARLDFDLGAQLPEVFSLKAWGLVLFASTSCFPCLATAVPFDLDQENVFVAGTTRVTITRPVSGDLFIARYADSSGSSFLKDAAGDMVQIERLWAGPRESAEEYNLGGVLIRPLGHCQLNLFATGEVTLELDPADCVPFSEWQKDKTAFRPPDLP